MSVGGIFVFAPSPVVFANNASTSDVSVALVLANGSATGGGVDYVLHCRRHLAPRFEAYLMRFCRHLGDSVLDVGAAVAGAPAWWDGRGGSGSYRSGC